MENRVPNYLRVENMEGKRGNEIRALFKLRCDLEEKNKYWLGIEKGGCLFCGESEDNLEYYVKECEETRNSFGRVKDGRIRTRL